VNGLRQSDNDEQTAAEQHASSGKRSGDRSKAKPKNLGDAFEKVKHKVREQNYNALKAEVKRLKQQVASKKRKAEDSEEEHASPVGKDNHKSQDKDAQGAKSTQHGTPQGPVYVPGWPFPGHGHYPAGVHPGQPHPAHMQWPAPMQWPAHMNDNNQTMREMMNQEQMQHQVKVQVRRAKQAMEEVAEEEEQHRYRMAGFMSMMGNPSSAPPSNKPAE
jgi:hypothetical protein